jgi:hypothetical protein
MEPTEPAEPTVSQVPREQRVRQWQDHLSQVRAVMDDHAQLAQRLRELHEQYRVLQGDPKVSAEERHTQTTDIIRAEGEVLAQAQYFQHVLQDLLEENHRLLVQLPR